ncbi:MAG: UDP-galactopyranose mutase [Bacteroidales bacterium]|nr:UDP-galactopyranose mutase [Bacteroidales bacterium]
MRKTFLIVGAGLYGAVCARELTDAGHRITVIEKRNHIGGNCYTEYDAQTDCHRHVYGPHIFHTDNEAVWRYMNRFVRFNHYVNRPKVFFKGKLYSFPINLFTLYQLYGVTTPQEAEAELARHSEPVKNPQNMEEWCLAEVGKEIYETFIKGYTIKQWGLHPRELPVSIIKRLPIRLTFDDNYFTHPYQGIPVGGYTSIFERLFEGVEMHTGVDFLQDRDHWIEKYDHVIYTGAIDAFFRYSQGVLGYRSLRFESECKDVTDFQGNAIINYTEEDVPYTRIVEHKHFEMNFSKQQTVITKEYPADWEVGREPFYPVDTDRNRELLAAYRKMAEPLLGKVTFGGRLGQYRYINMDQVVAAALAFIDGVI